MELAHTHMIAKVKAVGINFGWYIAAAVVAAVVEFTGTIDWTGWGVFGPAIGLAVAGGLDWLTSYMKRSRPEDVPVLAIDRDDEVIDREVL